MAEPAGPPPADPRCGTDAGYQAHLAADETACLPCREAQRTAHRTYELARRRAIKRLTTAHRPEYVALLAEERQKVAAGDAR